MCAPVMTGSHIVTHPTGGKFDSCGDVREAVTLHADGHRVPTPRPAR